jgi:hypothetical protein
LRQGFRGKGDSADPVRVFVALVYKIDRLTRSLADFAKLVEAFDARSISFVAVTQQFNTTSSMGWLTLNVLLSFAQFERELSSERVRDKIAASRRKGKWTGGSVPLGYDARDKKLVISPEEARTVSSGGLLTGKLFGERGNRMSPSYSGKSGVKHYYYVSSAIQSSFWRILPFRSRKGRPWRRFEDALVLQ